MDPFLGEIRLFGFNFAPQGWATCSGQIMSIAQNSALFSLLGTMYGGDGVTNFALPDLRGRAPIGQGNAPGLSPRIIGQIGGTETVTLIQSQMPQHSHGVNAAATSETKNPAGKLPGISAAGSAYGSSPSASMSGQMVGAAGGSQPHENMAPYLVGNWCIALDGIFPSRP
jgi:microcystin-dependent protein